MIKYYFLLWSAIVVLFVGCGTGGACCLGGVQDEDKSKSPTPITLSVNIAPVASIRAIDTTSADLSSCTTGQLFNFDGLDSTDSEDGVFNTQDHYVWYINDSLVSDVNSSDLYGISCPPAGTSKDVCLKVVDSDAKESENISCITLTAKPIVVAPTPCVAKITITKNSSGAVIGSNDIVKYSTRYNLSSEGSTTGTYVWGASSSFNNGTTNCFNDANMLDTNRRGPKTGATTWLETCRYNEGVNDYIDISLIVTTSDGTTCTASAHREVSFF